MKRRQVLGLLGSAGAATLCSVSGQVALAADPMPAYVPPRLTTEDLVRRMKEKGFVPDSVYAHELTFRGLIEIKREVPLVRINGVTGPLFAKAHLFGSGGNMDVGKELLITALIVGHGFGALQLWSRKCAYVTADQATDAKLERK